MTTIDKQRTAAVRKLEQLMDPNAQAIATRMIEDKIREEWFKISGIADCRVIVNYDEETGEWRARSVRADLELSDRLAFVTGVNRALQHHKLIIRVQLSPQ
jgi:hypothetical protein